MFDSIECIEEYAKEQFEFWGISNWSFVWNNRKTVIYGEAWYDYKKIELSTKFVLANWNNPRLIKDIILHEIAHALAYINRRCTDHGKDFLYYCNIVGAKPRQYITDSIKPKRTSKLVVQDDTYMLLS
jgi:predicted SprT family Zn-dependent metalloprotease